jgi:selenocysteine lyase/cysteine desulfurase
VQFATGFRLDLTEFGSFCRERGILLSIDAIQHLGALPFDVHDTPVDFVSAGAHKWLLSPCGSGVFYVRDELLEELRVTEVGYASTADYSINDELLNYSLELRTTAQRFEGGLATFSTYAGLGASVQLFMEVGIRNIADHIMLLTDTAAEGLQELGFTVLSPRMNSHEKSGILSFTHPNIAAQAIKKHLAQHSISISVRTVQGQPIVRISPHYYNSLEEVQQLLSILAQFVTSDSGTSRA